MVPPEVYYHLSAYDTPESRIIKPLDYFERNSSHVLVLEYLENSIDLFELIKRKGPLNEEIVKVIFAQILFMWESLNRAGICHRDIKVRFKFNPNFPNGKSPFSVNRFFRCIAFFVELSFSISRIG